MSLPAKRNFPLLKTLYRALKLALEHWRFILKATLLCFLVYVLVDSALAALIDTDTSSGETIQGAARALATTLLLAPMAIGLHRLVLLGERAGCWRQWVSWPRLLTYAAYAAIVEMAFPFVALAPLIENIPGVEEPLFDVRWLTPELLLVLTLVFLALFLLGWFMLVLPAVSTDRQGFGLRTALRLMWGNGWRYLGGNLLIFLPTVPVYVFFFWAIWGGEEENPFYVETVPVLFEYPFLVVIALFQALVFRQLATDEAGREE